MSHMLTIDDGVGVRKLPLKRGDSRLGSSPECELQIDHNEVQPVALMLNLRDDSLSVANYNPHSVYVGDSELPAGQSMSWPANVPLRMTRSITITFQANGAAAAGTAGAKAAEVEDKPASSSKKKLIQVGVILFCALVALTQMNNEPPAAAETAGLTFDGLNERIATTLESVRSDSAKLYDWKTVRRLLQEAEFLSFRPSEINTEQKIASYQRVLDHDLIRGSKAKDPESLEAAISQYATMRKEQLGKQRSF